MAGIQYLGKRCTYADTCPVFQGKLAVKNVPLMLIKNVFCNRGIKGWKNCRRFQLAEKGGEVPPTVTPYTKQL